MQVESVKLLMLEQPFDKHHPLDHHQSLPFFCFLATFVLIERIFLNTTSKSFFTSFRCKTCLVKSLFALSSLDAESELQLESISLVFSNLCNIFFCARIMDSTSC